ncbi:MAG TPA: uroporphyrinogen-III synthase [Roseibacterium sp.]|nr:uroporphyrinogen-III synthase [Roseibacterium sp.]
MTRPQGAAERFVAGLPDDLRRRLRPVYSPLIRIEPLKRQIEFGDARGIIFTSANGVEVAAGLTPQRHLPCYCVGAATCDAARQKGWQAKTIAENAEGLIAGLHHFRPPGPLLHLRGRHARANVAARLTALGLTTREQVIYDQPVTSFNETALAALTSRSAIIAPLFSPRTARQFANLVTHYPPLSIAALSMAVAESIKTLEYKRLVVSEKPDADMMAQAISMLINGTHRVEGTGPAQ